jgi:GTP pyrophosphokinase
MRDDYSRFRDDDNLGMLAGFALAPYIRLARSLISKKRTIGRNAFTHAIGTMAIAIDYKYNNSLILKGALCHDYLEDAEWANESDIANADYDGYEVLAIVKELTYFKNYEPKKNYLTRLKNARFESKVIKLCDRLDNLYTLLPGAISPHKILRIIKETEDFILPIAEDISQDFVNEMSDLLESRKQYLAKYLRVKRKSNYHDIFEYYHELNYLSSELD